MNKGKGILSVILVVICVYAAGLMMYSLHEREAPAPAPPGASPGAAPSATPSAEPAAPVNAEAATALYKSNCLACHGDQLQGGMGPELTKVGGAMTSDQIYNQIAKGGGGMPGFSGTLSDEEIKTLAGWLAAKK